MRILVDEPNLEVILLTFLTAKVNKESHSSHEFAL